MSGQTPVLHLPAEVARMLRCSEWWVKEQARKRRIPFSWIGGSYRFTDEHVAEIIRRFEKPAIDRPASVSAAPVPETVSEQQATCAPVIQLRARLPKRARVMDQQQAA
jgi:hypothetical protein